MVLLTRLYCTGLCLFLVGVNVASAQPVCPSQNFNTFIKAFASDESIQHNFVATPLKLVFIDSNENGQFVNDTLKLSHLPRSMFKKRGVKVSHC